MVSASVNARKKEQGLGKIHVAQIAGTKNGRALRPSALTLRKETPSSLLIRTALHDENTRTHSLAGKNVSHRTGGQIGGVLRLILFKKPPKSIPISEPAQ